MRSNRVGMKISIFCLAFLCGFLSVESVTENESKASLDRLLQAELKISKNFRIVEFEQSPAKPPCKRFSNHSELNNLVKELDELNKNLLEEMESSQDEKQTRGKLKKLEKEIKSLEDEKEEAIEETLEEFRERLESAKKPEQTAAQTLLHITDCVEYNNLR